MDLVFKVLPDNVKRLRLARKLTQEQLAEMAGIPLSTYLNVEYGKVWPQKETIKAIAVALDVNVNELFEHMPRRNPPTIEEARGTFERAVNFYVEYTHLKPQLRKLIDLIISGALDEAQADMLIHSISALNQPQTDKERRKA